MPFPHLRIIDPEQVWEPMPIGRALAWSRVLHRRVPVWPGGAGMWVVGNGRPLRVATRAARGRRKRHVSRREGHGRSAPG